MADYYVSSSGDNFTGDGSESTPFLTIGRAEVECTAGDNIRLLDTALKRDQIDTSLLPAAATTVNYHGASVASPSVLSTAFDMDEGTWNRRHENENWCMSASGFAATTGTITEETDANAAGGKAIRVDGTAVLSWARHDFRSGGTMRIKIIAKANTGTAYFRLRNGTSGDYYDLVAGTWGVSVNNTITSSATYQELTFDVTFPDMQGASQLLFIQPTVNSMDISHVEIFTRANWTVYSGDIYQCYYSEENASFETTTAHKATATAWAASGTSSLSALTAAGSLGAIAAGEFFVDGAAGTQTIYYKLATGESDITDVHIEVTRYKGHTLDQNANFYNISTTGSYFAFWQTAGTCNLINCHTTNGVYKRGFSAEGSSVMNCYNCTAQDVTGVGEGFISFDTSTMRCYGCHAEETGDECYQASGLSKIYLYGCTGKNTNGGGRIFEANFDDNQGASACTWEIHGCTFIQDVAGLLCVRAENDGTTTYSAAMSNNIFIQNGAGVNGPLDINTATETDVTLTASNNYCAGDYTGGAAQWTGKTGAAALTAFGATEISSGNLSIDESTFILNSDSTLIGAGTQWWTSTAPRPVSASGEPYPDRDIDVGGIQSTNSLLHPYNL